MNPMKTMTVWTEQGLPYALTFREALKLMKANLVTWTWNGDDTVPVVHDPTNLIVAK